jgi:hypothetical protein
VVGDLARDELVPLAAAVHAVPLAGDLQGRLDGLGPAVGEEDAVQVARSQRRDARGQLDGARVRVAPVREEAELLGLRRGGLAQLRAAVTGVDAEQRGQPVQVALAVLVPDVAAVTLDDHRQLVVGVRTHAREVHPQVPSRELLQFGLLRRLRRRRLEPRCHWDSPSRKNPVCRYGQR